MSAAVPAGVDALAPTVELVGEVKVVGKAPAGLEAGREAEDGALAGFRRRGTEGEREHQVGSRGGKLDFSGCGDVAVRFTEKRGQLRPSMS